MALMRAPPSVPPSVENESQSQRESGRDGCSSVVSAGSSAASAWAAAALAACAEASEHNRAAVVRAGGGAALATAMAEGGRELRMAAARAAAALADHGDGGGGSGGGFMATEARSAHAALWVEGLTRVIADALPATVTHHHTVSAISGILTPPAGGDSLLLGTLMVRDVARGCHQRAEGDVALALGALQALAECAAAGGSIVAAAARESGVLPLLLQIQGASPCCLYGESVHRRLDCCENIVLRWCVV
jgi:hypothetical protein